MLNANFVRTKTFPVARDILPETSQQLLSDKSKQQQRFPILRFYLEVSRVKITKCKFKMLIYNRNFSLCNFVFWAKILGTYSYTLLLYPQTIWAPQVCLRPRPRNFIYLLEYLLNSKFPNSGGILPTSFSLKFWKIDRETSVVKSPFNKVAGYNK